MPPCAVDEVADFYLKVRNDGGRFFIDDLGAYYKNADIGEGLNLFRLVQNQQMRLARNIPDAAPSRPA